LAAGGGDHEKKLDWKAAPEQKRYLFGNWIAWRRPMAQFEHKPPPPRTRKIKCPFSRQCSQEYFPRTAIQSQEERKVSGNCCSMHSEINLPRRLRNLGEKIRFGVTDWREMKWLRWPERTSPRT
jgi:hypothetical protein